MNIPADFSEDYQRLLNNLPGLVYRSAIHADGSRTLVYVSDGCYSLTGYHAQELMAMNRNPLMQFIDKKDYQYVWQTVTQAITEKRAYKMIYRMNIAKAGIRWVLDQGTPIYDEDGYPIGVEGLLINYTDEKLKEKQIERELESIRKKNKNYGDLVGSSKSMLQVFNLIEMASNNNFPVVILGPTGAGKEVVANEIVKRSAYKFPFVVVNCGAIPKDLLESAFFGHAKGAFTGALNDYMGYFAQANGGTLFLDEVADLTADMQVKLLRVLENKTYMRIGESITRTSDFRLISATNKNLEEEVKANRMREDFYYRIKVLSIVIPPLQDRKEDIPLITENLCMKIAGKSAIQILPIELRNSFEQYDWPGNIRELRNVIERYLAFGDSSLLPLTSAGNSGSVLTLTSTPLNIGSDEFDIPLKTLLQRYENSILRSRIDFFGGNKTKAARSLDISLQSLYRKLSEFEQN